MPCDYKKYPLNWKTEIVPYGSAKVEFLHRKELAKYTDLPVIPENDFFQLPQ